MSHYFWTLDEGHGSVNQSGIYTTPPEKGKQYKFLSDGFTIYEGLINRSIGAILKRHLKEKSIHYASVNDAILDTPLRERVELIDDYYHRERINGRKAILLSIHSNAMTPKEEIEGEGQEVASYNSVWTSKGQTQSDLVAPFFVDAYKSVLPDFRTATQKADGDDDFEADFYILRKSDGPAVLVESLFFDNRENAEFLSSNEGQQRIAEALLHAILAVEESKPI